MNSLVGVPLSPLTMAATEFNNNYPAGEYGGKTDLTTLNLNLSGAYRLNDNWSFGLGFDAVYADAKSSVIPGSKLLRCRKQQ